MFENIEKSEDVVKVEGFENSYWKEKFSGRLVQFLHFDYLYDDEDWTSTWEPICVTYRYFDDGKEDMVGLDMFKLNYKFYSSSLNRLQKILQS